MKNIRFLDQATEDFQTAVDYYNSERPGLGYEFANEIRTTLARINSFPEVWPVIDNGIRKCIVKRFPYALIYSIQNDLIVIIAVMHMKRKPGYWDNKKPNH